MILLYYAMSWGNIVFFQIILHLITFLKINNMLYIINLRFCENNNKQYDLQ